MNLRLFFGATLRAAWPAAFPPGRLVPDSSRHLTLAFLGDARMPDVAKIAPLKIAPTGVCLKWKPLAHVAAAEASWLTGSDAILALQKRLVSWLHLKDQRPFYPHITLARSPFDREAWKNAVCQVPFYLQSIHLYQSRQNSLYESLWEMPLVPPFDDIDHTADLAFLVRGQTLHELFLHAQLALAFHFPPFVEKMRRGVIPSTLDDIIIELNALISEADETRGCPFKAVSFHGALASKTLLEWTMIVDV